jgi:Holliday junction resolvase
MNNYTRGVVIERRAQAELEALGYLVIRAAGSKGPADLVAIAPGGVRLIQCKRTSGRAGSGLRATLRDLAALSIPDNATAEVWQWCDGRGWARWLVSGPIPAGWDGGLAD